MQFALNLPLAKFIQEDVLTGGEALAQMARALEAAGVSAALTSEHPAPSSHWLHNDPTGHDCVDPLIALSILAGMSKSLKLFTNILVLPYRNPFLTAKAAATLQILSDNRLLLGVGVGYQRSEFEALGVPFKERGFLMDEALETIRAAWAGGAVVKKGRYFDARENEPRPVPTSPPPIWIGGGSDKAIDRAARWGDGWNPYFTVPTNDPEVRKSAVVDFEHFDEKLALLEEKRAAYGKSGPFDLVVAPPFRPQTPSAENAERFLEEVAQLKARGVNWVWTSLPASSPQQYFDMVAWFGEEIIAKAGAS